MNQTKKDLAVKRSISLKQELWDFIDHCKGDFGDRSKVIRKALTVYRDIIESQNGKAKKKKKK